MKHGYSLLLRFIDLGLLLLMAFLAVADLGSALQVPLPGRQSGVQPGKITHRVRAAPGAHYALVALPQGGTVCSATGRDALLECLMKPGIGDVVIRSVGDTSVQEIVDVLDLCEHAHQYCTLEHDNE